MFAMGVDKPIINYEAYILTCQLNDEQLEHAISMKAHLVERTVIK